MSPFLYTVGNPIVYIDPDGREVVNEYENYKQYKGLEEQLRSKIENASTRGEKKAARKELRANQEKINGYNNFVAVDNLLKEFKTQNEAEYNRLDNLEFNGVEIDLIVGLTNMSKGDFGQYGQTNCPFDPKQIMSVTDLESGEKYDLPTAIIDNKISITLFNYGRNINTLANEFGDAIFSVSNPRKSYEDNKNEVPYYNRSSTKFSFDYESYIMGVKSRPEPENY